MKILSISSLLLIAGTVYCDTPSTSSPNNTPQQKELDKKELELQTAFLEKLAYSTEAWKKFIQFEKIKYGSREVDVDSRRLSLEKQLQLFKADCDKSAMPNSNACRLFEKFQEFITLFNEQLKEIEFNAYNTPEAKTFEAFSKNCSDTKSEKKAEL